MQILLIGGTGFIGEYLTKELAKKKNCKVVVGYFKNEPEKRIKSVFYEKFSIEQRDSKFEKLVCSSDIVVIMTRPEQASIENLIKALRQSHKLKKIIYLSTLLLYKDFSRPQNEEAELKPLTNHEKNKYNEEKKLIGFAKKNNCQFCLARLGNVYGDIKNRGILNWIFLSVLKNSPLDINGNGRQIRDFIFVEDAANLLNFLIFFNQKNKIEIFNICSQKGISIVELIEKAEKITNHKLNLNFNSPILEKEKIIGNNKKILNASGYQLKYDIEKGLKRTYQNYLTKLKIMTTDKFLEEFGGKTILVTGGTGSIGSVIVKELLNYQPHQVRVFSRDETKQFELAHEIGPDKPVRYLIGDVRDKERLNLAMENVDIIFHSAALKHVAACERNPFEAVKTNVSGTQNIIDCAFANNVEKVISISTDKATAPMNVMGCTKLLAEKLILGTFFYKGHKRTKFCCVRFGNVLGSRGSVVSLFAKQILNGSSLTLTDNSMTRFVMTIAQAVNLVLKSATIMQDREIFILKMPVATIVGIAKAMIEIAKERLGILKKVDIKLIGRKEGERIHEKLLTQEESESALETNEMFIIVPDIALAPPLPHFEKPHYQGARKAKAGEYNTKAQKKMTIKEIKELLEEVKPFN